MYNFNIFTRIKLQGYRAYLFYTCDIYILRVYMDRNLLKKNKQKERNFKFTLKV